MRRTTGIGAALVVVATAAVTFGISSPANAAIGVAQIGPGPSGNTTGVVCVQNAVGVAQDGQYGQQTYTAVKRFQTAHGLSADGAVGPRTGNAIISVENSRGYTGCYSYVPTTY